jgi:hypothetical protein
MKAKLLIILTAIFLYTCSNAFALPDYLKYKSDFSLESSKKGKTVNNYNTNNYYNYKEPKQDRLKYNPIERRYEYAN